MTVGPSPDDAQDSIAIADQLERDVAAGLAALAEASNRPYSRVQTDGEERTRYYAAIDPALDPSALYGSLRALPEASQTNRPPYKPVVGLYP